jgi:hypothetical protein
MQYLLKLVQVHVKYKLISLISLMFFTFLRYGSWFWFKNIIIKKIIIISSQVNIRTILESQTHCFMNNHGDVEVVGILTHVPSRSLSWTTFKSTCLNASNYEDFHKCHVSLRPKSTQKKNWKFVKWNNAWGMWIFLKKIGYR